MLPEDWADRCTIKEDENGFTIYQTASYEDGRTWLPVFL